jgi:glycosyltransferase involved in cell wall biosynthesis
MGPHCFRELSRFPVMIDTWFNYHFARARLHSALRRHPCDVVHCWGTESPYPSVLGWSGARTLLAMNGVLNSLATRNVLPEGWWWKRQVRHEARWLGRADAVSVESKWAAAEAQKVVPSVPVSIVPYGVDPAFFATRWEPDRENPYLLFAGTLCRGKGFDTLISALERLGTRTWTCKVAGQGPLYHPAMRRRLARMEWLGSLRWEDYREVLRHASCLVLPTRADSNPNVIKEARVVGLPVVTTSEGGQADYLRDRENSWLIAPGDAAELAAVLHACMSEPLALTRVGRIGWEEDRNRFESRQTVSRFMALYRSLVLQQA